MSFFQVLHRSSKSAARTGRIVTKHGIIETPAFVPVATHGTLKGVNSLMARRIAQCMFVNTYHQLVQPPGVDVIGAAGGLHAFMNFDKPLFTDSGGFQVFSLGQQHNDDDNDDDSTTTMIDVTKPELKGQQRGRYEASVSRLSEEGVLFKSYLNGDEIMLTPESSVEAQQKLGADIIVPLDELPSNNVSKQRIHQSLLRTNRWQLRSLATHRRRDLSSTSNDQQSMYGVVHGGVHHDLRKQSIDFVVKQTFEGIAVGGSLGSSRQEMYELLEQCVMPTIHEADDDALRRPIHLLGIGDTPSIVRLVTQGIDTFDSAYPSRCGRHGTLLRFDHNSNVRNNTNYNNDFPRRYNNNNDDNNFENNDNNDVDNQYPFDNDNFQLPSISSFKATSSELAGMFDKPIDVRCRCFTCRHYSQSYLHHLYKAHESVAGELGTIHNIYVMKQLMQRLRFLIQNDAI